ncbi:MAG: ribonuclease III family protein [Candidatus Freyarchaeota archaeon]
MLTNKQLAKVGDGVANLIYSLALLMATGKVKTTKVPGFVLSSALKSSGLRSHLPSRQNTHSLSDAAEALIAYAWLTGVIEIKEAAKHVATFLSANCTHQKNLEHAILAFSTLLKTILYCIKDRMENLKFNPSEDLQK